jgi:hypothetical protein
MRLWLKDLLPQGRLTSSRMLLTAVAYVFGKEMVDMRAYLLAVNIDGEAKGLTPRETDFSSSRALNT